MRICQLQIDKSTKLEWPALSAIRATESRSMVDLFQPALALEVTFGDAHLDGFCSAAALQRRLNTCAQCDRNEWHAHLVLVEQVEFQGRRPMGLMFDSMRRGCAVSHRAINSFCRRYPALPVDWLLLRTVGHELGHLLNLGHDERPSLMTPLRWFLGRGCFPTNLAFDLATGQQRWLSQGPVIEVQPGGSQFHGRGGYVT